jgi:hypothetical protein
VTFVIYKYEKYVIIDVIPGLETLSQRYAAAKKRSFYEIFDGQISHIDFMFAAAITVHHRRRYDFSGFDSRCHQLFVLLHRRIECAACFFLFILRRQYGCPCVRNVFTGFTV